MINFNFKKNSNLTLITIKTSNLNDSIFKFQFSISHSKWQFNFQVSIFNFQSKLQFNFQVQIQLKNFNKKRTSKVVTFLFFLTFGKSKKSKNVYYSLTIFFLKKSFFWLRPFHQDCIVPPLLYTFLDYFK